MPGIMLLFLLSMLGASAGQAQRVWEMTCEDGSTHAGPSIDAILANRPSGDKCTVEDRGGAERSLPKASMSTCPIWCTEPFARSWACDTDECAACLTDCKATPLPMKLPASSVREATDKALIPRDTQARAVSAHTWTCPKSWPPKNFVVIFSMMRSATTTFCGVMNTMPDTSCAYELLNPRWISKQAQGLLAHGDVEAAMRGEFEALHAGFGHAPCTWGFKVFRGHVSSDALHWLTHHVNVAIVLQRLDTAAQLASLWRAQATRCWMSTGLCADPADLKPPGPWALRSHAQNVSSWYSTVRTHLLSSPARVKHISTEDFLERGRSTWRPYMESLLNETSKPALQLPRPSADTCDLCAKEWVFILSTGRAGSTSIMEALNALPNVKISGENQASLEAAAELLGRHLEHIDREMVVQDASTNAAMAHGNINKQVLLCNLQRWFIELSGATSEAHGQTRAREQNTAPYPCPDPRPSNALLPTLKPSPLPATHPQASRSGLRSSLPCKLRARCTTTATAPRPRDICPWSWATNRAGFVFWTLSFPVPASSSTRVATQLLRRARAFTQSREALLKSWTRSTQP